MPHKPALLWTSAPLLQVPEARELRSSWFRKQGIKLSRSYLFPFPFSFWTKITGTAPKNERLQTAVYNPRKSRRLQQASTRALHRVRNKRFLATIDADFQTPKLLFAKRKTDSRNRISPAWMKIGLGTKSDLRVVCLIRNMKYRCGKSTQRDGSATALHGERERNQQSINSTADSAESAESAQPNNQTFTVRNLNPKRNRPANGGRWFWTDRGRGKEWW